MGLGDNLWVLEAMMGLEVRLGGQPFRFEEKKSGKSKVTNPPAN